MRHADATPVDITVTGSDGLPQATVTDGRSRRRGAAAAAAWRTRCARSPRERGCSGSLMAEGHSNPPIAARLFVSEKAVSKHAAGIFANLGLAPSEDDNRRVRLSSPTSNWSTFP